MRVDAINLWVRRLVLLIPPLLLAFLEMQHPTKFKYDIFNILQPHVDWWIELHLYQLVLFGLMGAAVWQLTSGMTGWLVFFSRLGVWSFLIFYSAYDSIAGLSTGLIIRDAQHLPAEQQTIIAQALQRFFHDPVLGGTHSWLSKIASLSWLVAIGSAGTILYIKGKGRLPAFLFILSGFLLYSNHAPPTGPLAFACFFVGAAWLEFVPVQQKE